MARGPGGGGRTQEWPREELLRGPSFPGRGEWATLRGWGAEGEQFGMGQRAPRAGGDPRRRRGAKKKKNAFYAFSPLAPVCLQV